jgi:acyl-CoA thioesterase-1
MQSPLRLLVLLCAVVPMLTCNRAAEPGCEVLRVMPLGDSITEAEGGHASYRYWLFELLEREGRRVDFVGSQRGVYRGAPQFVDFDQDHEGHWGWTTLEVRKEIHAWAAQSAPDVVLLMLGTNDGARNLVATRGNLSVIIASLREHRPGVLILLAKVPPVGDRESGALIPDIPVLNRAISGLAERLDRPDSRVIVVDQHTDFDIREDTYDGVHASESGERKLAARWLDAMNAIAPWRNEGCGRGGPG